MCTVSVMRQIVRRSELSLFLALMSGIIPPLLAQPVAVSKLTLPQGANDVVWDPTRSRFFASSGTKVVMIDPGKASVDDTIAVGNRANVIAVSGDGQYVYVAFIGLGTIGRYQIQSHSLDLQIDLGTDTGGNTPREVQAMVVLPGQPSSILVATSDKQVIVFDGAVPRAGKEALILSSLYARPSDGQIFGLGGRQSAFGFAEVFWFGINSNGVAATRSVPVGFGWENVGVSWNGNFLASPEGFVFDLNAGATIGRIPSTLAASTQENGACLLAVDSTGSSAIAFEYTYLSPVTSSNLVQYPLADFQPAARAAVTGLGQDVTSNSGPCYSSVATGGGDGILLNEGFEGGSILFLHAAGFSPLEPVPLPTPTQDSSGVIHLALPANGLTYDAQRNLLWASVPGNAPSGGNSVVSIDPGTGNVAGSIYAGSEPGALALSGDGSHLFAALAGAPAIASLDLLAKQSSTFSALDVSGTAYWSIKGLAGISGESNSVVAVRYGGDYFSSVIAYDAGVPRPNTFDYGTGSSLFNQYVQVIFPADGPNTLYAVDAAINYPGNIHDVYRLTVDASGVNLDADLNRIFLGTGAGAYGSLAYNQPVDLVSDSGRLFTSAGQILTPDTMRLLGSVLLAPAYGMPVPFSGQNVFAYVQSYSPQMSATLYDLGTLRPLRTVPLVTGPPCGCTSNSPAVVNVTAAVRAGNSAIAVAVNGEIVIAPLSSFQPWPSGSGSLQPVSPGVQEVNLPVNAIGVLPGSSKLLLATPGRAGSAGNSIVTYDPQTGQVDDAAFIGSEPSLLAVTPDGSAAYAYLSGEEDIARFNLTTGARDLVFAPDPSGGTSQYTIFDMAVGADGGLALSYSGTFAFQGVVEPLSLDGTIAIFDNGIPRPEVDSNSQGPFPYDPATFTLAFNDSGSRLYAFNSFVSTFELKTDAVSAQGLLWLSTVPGVITGSYTRIRQAQGLLYTSYGDVVDPGHLLVVGHFADPWLNMPVADDVAVDVAGGRAYFATRSGILMFDLNSHSLLGRLPVNLQGYGLSLLRFGADGLALLTDTGTLYLTSISSIPLLPAPIPSPQPPGVAWNGVVPLDSSVPVIEPGSWVSIFGENLAGSSASWNGDFPTTLAGASVTIDGVPAYLSYVSPNQINVQAPDDSFIGRSVSVKVTTPNGSSTTSVTLSKFGPSLCLFGNQYVAAEIPTPSGSGTYGGGTYDLAGPAGFFSFKTRPVKPGETLELYGVGFGPTDPPVPAGRLVTAAAPTTYPVTVTIGGEPAQVVFSGIVLAGLYQINVVVPRVPAGDQPIQAAVGGVNAPLALVTVH